MLYNYSNIKGYNYFFPPLALTTLKLLKNVTQHFICFTVSLNRCHPAVITLTLYVILLNPAEKSSLTLIQVTVCLAYWLSPKHGMLSVHKSIIQHFPVVLWLS